MTAYVPFGESWGEIQRSSAAFIVSIASLPQLDDSAKFAVVEQLLYQLAPLQEDFAGLVRDIPTPRRAIPEVVRRRIIERDGHCLNCGSEENLTVDHVVPLDAGGAHNEENFQTLCGPCNSCKGTQAIDYRLDRASETP